MSRRGAGLAAAVSSVLLWVSACVGPPATGPEPNSGSSAGTGPTVAAPTGCRVDYRAVASRAGFTADLIITDLGGELGGWTVEFDLGSPGQQLLDGWNADWKQSGQHVTMGANGSSMAPTAPVTVGFDANGTATAVPHRFTLNGVACHEATSVDSGALSATTPITPSLRIAGGKLVDDLGAAVQLAGVNRSGGEYTCVKGHGIWDGPVDDTSLQAIRSWNVNAVRVPLNEDCWLSLNAVRPENSGVNYRKAVVEFVARLEAHGLVPILDLHWTDGVWTGGGSQCSYYTAYCQKPMPDRAHSIDFWTSVAETFKTDQSVIFDLFNEPYPSNTRVMNLDQSWNCWHDGGNACPGLTYAAAGIQQLVDAVRATGALNVVLATANSYGQLLEGYLSHRLHDPTGNLAVAWHWYSSPACHAVGCWNKKLESLNGFPVIATEVGEFDCSSNAVVPMMSWADGHHLSYLAWTWNVWDCGAGPALISDYSGAPTAFGAGVRAHFLTRGSG
jgi:endoglucanase